MVFVSSVTSLALTSSCLTCILIAELAVISRIALGANSRLLKVLMLLMVTGTLSAIGYAAVRYKLT